MGLANLALLLLCIFQNVFTVIFINLVATKGMNLNNVININIVELDLCLNNNINVCQGNINAEDIIDKNAPKHLHVIKLVKDLQDCNSKEETNNFQIVYTKI
jgi:hypothetical protein